MAGNTELVDEIIDLSAVEKQKKATIDALKEIKMAINEVGKLEITAKNPNNGFAATIKNLQQVNKVSEQYQKVLNSEAKARLTNARAAQIEQKAKEASAKANEREAVSSNKKNNANREAVRAYKSLVREYTILRKVAEDYGASLGTQSKQYIEAAKRANELNDRLKQIDQGIGNSQRNVGNYKSGFDGLSNSINQISRELPAFANSAQTGFLALSNNIPILFDELKRINQEVKTLRQQGQQTPGVFQRVATSFLSWQTVLSFGVTLLTIYGKEIGNFVSSLFKGTQSLNAFAERQRILSESLKESSNGFKESFQAISELRINVDLAKKGFLDKDEVLKQYNKTIGATTGQVETLDQVEQQLVKNGEAYIKMMLLKAAAQLALEEASKKALQAEIDRQKNEDDFINNFDRARSTIFTPTAPGFVPQQNQEAERQAAEFRKKQGAARQKQLVKQSQDEAKALTKIAADFQKQAAEISKGFNLDFFGGTDDGKKTNDRLKTVRQELFQEERKAFQKQLEELSKDEAISLQGRLAFREEAAELEKKIIREAAEFEIQQERDKLNAVLTDKDSTKNARINAQEEFNATVASINRKAAFEQASAATKLELDLGKIKGDSLDRQRKQYDEEFRELVESNKRKEEEQDRFNKTQQDIDEQGLTNAFEERIAILDRNFAKIDRKRKDFPEQERKYNEARIKIQEEYQIRALESQIQFAEQQLAIEKQRALGTNDREALQKIELAEKNLAGLRISLSKLVADTAIKQQKRVSDAEEEELQKRLKNIREQNQTALSLLTTLSEIANIGNEAEKNRIQEEIDLIEKKKQKEIEAIQATTASAEEKAAKIKIVEARTAAQREQLELRQRQLEQRRARFQKALSIATIIASTREAVVAALGSKPYTPANIAFAAIVGAIGAAQLATVIATPIPKYKDGTKNHPGGLAIVGDGGRKEVAVTPQGDIFTTSAFPSLVNLPKGTQVFKSEKDFTDATLAKTLSPLGQLPGIQLDNSYMETLMEKQVKKLDGITNAIKNQPRPVGPTKTRTGQSFVDYVNKNVRN